MAKFLGPSLKLSNHNCWNVTQNVIKYGRLQSWEISSNTSLLEFDLAKADLRLPSWPKVKFKEDFLNIFHFTLPLFHALFKRWISIKIIVTLVWFTPYYNRLTKRFEIMARATVRKNLGSPMPKQSDDSVFQKIKSSRQHARFCGLSNWCFE